MNFLEKLQKKPEKTRKRIFWLVLIISVLIIGFFWIKNLGHLLVRFKAETQNVKNSSQNLTEEIKRESPLTTLKEGIKSFEDFLKSEEVKKFFEQNSKNQ